MLRIYSYKRVVNVISWGTLFFFAIFTIFAIKKIKESFQFQNEIAQIGQKGNLGQRQIGSKKIVRKENSPERNWHKTKLA